jgi:hypothetical protein
MLRTAPPRTAARLDRRPRGARLSEPLIPYVSLPELRLTFLEHVPLIGQLIDGNDPPSIKSFGAFAVLWKRGPRRLGFFGWTVPARADGIPA